MKMLHKLTHVVQCAVLACQHVMQGLQGWHAVILYVSGACRTTAKLSSKQKRAMSVLL